MEDVKKCATEGFEAYEIRPRKLLNVNLSYLFDDSCMVQNRFALKQTN